HDYRACSWRHIWHDLGNGIQHRESDREHVSSLPIKLRSDHWRDAFFGEAATVSLLVGTLKRRSAAVVHRQADLADGPRHESDYLPSRHHRCAESEYP